MTYIPKEYKQRFDPHLQQIQWQFKEAFLRDQGERPKLSGILNYCLTRVGWSYIDATGRRYSSYNDVLGALEGSKLELYRRKQGPYEEHKKDANGDVYLAFPGKAAMERHAVLEEICQIIALSGRPFVAHQVRDGQYTARVALAFLLSEPGWTDEDIHNLERARGLAQQFGL